MRSLLLLLVLTFMCFSSKAQQYSFISFSTPEGLPQSQVNSITQDKDGYLWVGTFGGLSKFNGRNFVNYSVSDGLLNNRVHSLSYIDSQLFVGHNNGISFQCENDSFCHKVLPDDVPLSNISKIVRFKDEIFVATNGSGLFKVQEDQKQLLPIKNSPLRIRSMVVHSNHLLMATREGIFRFKENQFKLDTSFITASFSDIDVVKNTIFATTFSGEVYKKSNQESSKLYYESNTHRFRNILCINEDLIWLNSRYGAIKIENAEEIHINEQSGLPINDINIIFKDREKNIWLGTGGKGLLKFSGELFTHFNKKSGLPSELIISSLEDNQGNYWLSSFDKGVFKFNKEPKSTIENIPYLSSTVWSSAKNKELLIFGSVFGLHVYNKESWKSYYSEDGLPANKITGLYTGENGVVYVGTADGIVKYFDNKLDNKSLGNNAIINARDFVEKDDTLFIAAQKGIYSLKDNKSAIVAKFEGGVNSLALDNKKRIWAGTENGLFYYQNGKVIAFDLEQSGGTDYINFIQQHKEQLFVGTNNGLFLIKTNDLSVEYYGINAGLVDLETNLNSAFIDSKENLWFGTVAGLMKMDLSITPPDKSKIYPKIHLASLAVNFEEKDITTKELNQLKLTHKQNNISFEFDGVYLTNPNSIRYTYKLEGLSSEWSPLLSNNTFSFNNLSPGEYKLMIKAVRNEKDFNSAIPFVASFEITPPFYQTWWFYTLLFLLIVGSFIMIDQLRISTIKRKNYQLNLEVKNKLAQLEQQSLNASMNRHFIFNSLNSIQYYINASDKKAANKYLTRFARLIRKNLDSSHAKNGMVSLSDEIDRLKLYMDLETMRFKNKFDYEINIDKNVEIELLKVPAMFLQPFVENSIIHGLLPLKDRKGKVTVTVSDHFDHIRIEILDNGIGIENSLNTKSDGAGDHESQGVLITLGRIELLQKISARSIELIGPHQINETDKSVKGTLVTFKIIKQFLEK